MPCYDAVDFFGLELFECRLEVFFNVTERTFDNFKSLVFEFYGEFFVKRFRSRSYDKITVIVKFYVQGQKADFDFFFHGNSHFHIFMPKSSAAFLYMMFSTSSFVSVSSSAQRLKLRSSSYINVVISEASSTSLI